MQHRTTILGFIIAVSILSVFLINNQEAESFLAIPPTSAFSIFLSDTFGVNISAIFSTDSATFSGGDLTFFPGNQTINFGPNATALFEQLNSTLFSLNGSVPVLIEGDQIDLTAIGNLTEISLEDCLQDQMLFYDGGVWTCIDSSTINGTGGTGGTGGPHIEELTDVYFNAEEATIDDMTGANCVNDIAYGFFDNTLEHQYERQVIEFCGDADEDDNITWLYVVPQQYNTSDATDFEYNLFWTDDSGGGGSVVRSTIASSDDAHEDVTLGIMDLTDSDIRFREDTFFNGFRWTNIAIPNSATITSATIQFHVDTIDVPEEPLTITFHGEDVDNASTFTGVNFNISDRTTTTASVNWAIPSWVSIHDEGPAQLTPDLSSIIQEIVDRPGWVSGNSLVIINDDSIGDGKREAESFDGEASNSPELSISFTSGGGGLLPVCWEFSLITLANSELMDGDFKAFQTVCTPRSGVDQLTLTTFPVTAVSHEFMLGDLVFFKIHRPNDFVINDFYGEIFLFGSELKWQN